MREIKADIKNAKYSKRFIQEALEDFKTACISREASTLGRKEVLTGKAKFGIFGAGKEVAQVAMARAFKKGDFRSGYYRDQTFMLALGLATVENLYAQLYAHADPAHDPFSAGRQMNAHFATPFFDKQGNVINLKDQLNVSSDISPTAGQMARALGLALASKKFRSAPELQETPLSNNGNEVCFCTIGDASTSEGIFWETMNAASVMQVPLAVFVWDDGYGISVPKKYQTVKASISKALAGMQANEEEKGLDIHQVKGWDYAALRACYDKGIKKVREEHAPCLFHVDEITQPQGHSTSGSHERYKSKDRLAWEEEYDCIEQMKLWLVREGLAQSEDLEQIRKDARKEVLTKIKNAWSNYTTPIKTELTEVLNLIEAVAEVSSQKPRIDAQYTKLKKALNPTHKEAIKAARNVLRISRGENTAARTALSQWTQTKVEEGRYRYTSSLYSETPLSALKVKEVPAVYKEDAPLINGYEILNRCFDKHLAQNPKLYAFGEDVGYIGDVNQGFAGMQAKYGEERVFDTGIREWTICGQALGLAMRGLRPIAEMQYLDYLIYGISALSDDLATLRYRSNGIQSAPAIIRTRGHRLEGIWHSGSPFGMLLGTMRGICLLVPRNMTQAAGFYNTMLQSDDPAIIVECLNGYRLKEKLVDNIDTFTVPVGIPETLQEGTDVTLVTYGSCIRIAQTAMQQLEEEGISVELIDVQSLLPFDVEHKIVESLKKTNRLVCLDEDVPGGATAYMMQKILEEQKGYYHLDSEPLCISAAAVRPPYGSDGDYFTKPSAEDIFEGIYNLMHESNPNKFPELY